MPLPKRHDETETINQNERVGDENVPPGKEDNMAEMITDKTMDEIEILAKLHLTEEEKETSRQEMQKMLDYVDMLNKLDTDGVEPLTHIFPVQNVFREDEPLTSTPREILLKNAPKEKEGQFLVPKTIG